jgi:hypothetical protein
VHDDSPVSHVLIISLSSVISFITDSKDICNLYLNSYINCKKGLQ